MAFGDAAFAIEFGATQELQRLLDVLLDVQQTAASIVKQFRDAFAPARYVAVCGQLSLLWRHFLRAHDGGALLALLCVVDAMRRDGCAAAAALQCDVMLDLERVLRRDLLTAEQVKYAVKDGSAGGGVGNGVGGSSAASNSKATDAAFADVYRVHLAVKVAGLQLLSDVPMPSDKLTQLLSRRQDALEQALEACEKSGKPIKEQFAQLARAQRAMHERHRIDVLRAHSAPLDTHTSSVFAGATLPLACAPLPPMPVQHGELHYFLPTNVSHALCYDVAATRVPEAYRGLRDLLSTACQSCLPKEAVQELLQHLAEDAVRHMGIDDAMVRGLAVHNAEVCAAVLNRLPCAVASVHVQRLLTGDMRDKVDTILLHAAKVLDHTNVCTFVMNKLTALRRSSPAVSTDIEALRSFALVLHQLLTKAAKDNKQIYLTNELKRDLEQLFVDSGAPEVVSRWDEMKK